MGKDFFYTMWAHTHTITHTRTCEPSGHKQKVPLDSSEHTYFDRKISSRVTLTPRFCSSIEIEQMEKPGTFPSWSKGQGPFPKSSWGPPLTPLRYLPYGKCPFWFLKDRRSPHCLLFIQRFWTHRGFNFITGGSLSQEHQNHFTHPFLQSLLITV